MTKAGIGQVCKDFPDLEIVYKLTEKEASIYPITAEMVGEALRKRRSARRWG